MSKRLVLVTFDGQLLFHNNCRPFECVAEFTNFADTSAALRYIICNKDGKCKSVYKFMIDEMIEASDYNLLKWGPTIGDQVKAWQRIFRESWETGGISAMEFVERDTNLFNILLQHRDALSGYCTRLPCFDYSIEIAEIFLGRLLPPEIVQMIVSYATMR
jgi:hypothetical protein